MIKVVNITYIRPNIKKGDDDTASSWLQIDLPVKINLLNSIEEVFPLLSSPSFNADIIAIDLEYFHEIKGVGAFDIINTLRTLISCTVFRDGSDIKPVKRKTKLIGMVGHNTNPALIKELEKSVDKLVIRCGGDFSYDDMKSDLESLLSGDMTTNKKIHELYKIKKKYSTKSPEIILTQRQSQILDLISNRGISNKVIAKLLHISESTVKLHMSAILKKYGVKNRTQLVLFSKQQHDD